jgi:two-component system response regulator (stage 0 sporulation protein F)
MNRYGYRSLLYADGEAALSPLASGVPIDAAIIDLIMPGMSGLEFLVRARWIAPHLPCIVLSGYSSTEQYLKAMQLGATEYLNKPVRIRELGKVVASVLEKNLSGGWKDESKLLGA